VEPVEPFHRNEITLVGRLAAEASERVMPSGSTLCSFRLVIRRNNPGQGPPVDTLDCAAWSRSVRRVARLWSAGDLVEVRGALRRRFWRGPGGVVSRCEVEVGSARRLACAGQPSPGVRLGRGLPVARASPGQPAPADPCGSVESGTATSS
jgi:single-strand DNA-binding protein